MSKKIPIGVKRMNPVALGVISPKKKVSLAGDSSQ